MEFLDSLSQTLVSKDMLSSLDFADLWLQLYI